MPMKWIEPDLFAIIEGVPVYHAYKNGSYEHRLLHHFTTDGTESDDSYEFDVRDVAAQVGTEVPTTVFFGQRVKDVIALGLSQGVIAVPSTEDEE